MGRKDVDRGSCLGRGHWLGRGHRLGRGHWLGRVTSSLAGQTLYPIRRERKGLVKFTYAFGLALSAQV